MAGSALSGDTGDDAAKLGFSSITTLSRSRSAERRRPQTSNSDAARTISTKPTWILGSRQRPSCGKRGPGILRRRTRPGARRAEHSVGVAAHRNVEVAVNFRSFPVHSNRFLYEETLPRSSSQVTEHRATCRGVQFDV